MKVSNNNTEEMKYQNTRHVSKRAANVVMGQKALLWFFSELRNLTIADNTEKCKYRENGTFQSVGDIRSFPKGLSEVLCYFNFNSKLYDSTSLTLLKSPKRGSDVLEIYHLR